ncbi:MAG: cell division protein FtsZ [Magnetospirillum sp.]|jgi:cell division protein FtsZ|nr:cell division protein FtsZ [Magnetospirillum sp.]
MAITLGTIPGELKPRITVVGVGGAGGNAVNNMIRARLEGVEFVVANTDAQALGQSIAERKLQLGVGVTQGLGAGSRPDVGRVAAEESMGDLLEHIQGSHMVFVAAGMGGGTGTGAAPVIARACREHGILTVGVVTKPFHFEGTHRMKLAEAGIEELQQTVDTLIIIPNQNLFRVANERTTFADAFKMADDVLYSGVRGVTDLMVMPGLINLDFADIRSVMGEMGKAMMGTGEAEGDSRAIDAAQKAISNPLLDDVSMKGAKGVLINITGGMDMTLFEVDEAANRIRDEVDPEANIIFGSTFDETLNGRMRVSVVATGIDAAAAVQPKPQTTVVSFARPAARPTVPAPMTTTAPAAVAAATSIPAMPNMVPATVAQSAPIQQTATALKLEAAPIPVFEAAPLAAPALPLAVEPAPVAAQPVAPQPVEAYIPPKPVEVAQAAASPANPFAEAELVNAAKTAAPAAKPAPRKVSLFERMTRTGQARSEAAPAAAEPVRSQPTLAAPIGAMTLPTQPAAAAAPAPATAPAAPATSQPRLGGLDPADRIQSKTEDDLLEIPAFLRRQAN